MSSSTEDLRVELEYLRDNVVLAAGAGQTGLVESGLETYSALIEAFLDVLVEFGSPYDQARARAEMHSIGAGWAEIEWIADDYREIADAAFDARNLSVLLKVLYFPVHLAQLAYLKNDYYVFAQFVRWSAYLYQSSLDLGEALGETVRRRIRDYLVQFCNWTIEPTLEEAREPHEIARQCEFAGGIAVAFNGLMKTAYDKRRREDFILFAGGLQSLYRAVERQSPWQELRGLVDFEDPASDSSVPSPGPDSQEVCLRQLTLRRQVILLGLDAWILRDYERDRLDSEEVRAWDDAISLPPNALELWSLYLHSRDRRWEEELGWSWWELEEHRDEQFYTGIAFDLLLLRPTLLRMLRSLAELSDEQLEQFRIPPSSALDYLGRPDSPLFSTLAQFADGVDNWAPLLPARTFEMIPLLRRRVEEAHADTVRLEREQVRTAPLSERRINEVKGEILRGWHEPGHLRRLFEEFRNIERLGEPPDGLEFFGIHTLDLKDLYIERSTFSSSGWGAEYGRSLARGEDERVLAELLSGARATDGGAESRSLAESLNEAVHTIKSHSGDPVILIVNSWEATSALAASGLFEYGPPDGEKARHMPPVGSFEEIPVYVFHAEIEPAVVAVDIRRAVSWRQYVPRLREEGMEILGDVLRFLVRGFSEDEARSYLEANEQLLLESNGEALTFDQRVQLLQERVRLLVQEQFEVTLSDPQLAIRIPL